MSTKQIDPTAEEFCRIVAQMIVETARNGAQLVARKISKKAKKVTAVRK
jgi:hypothetical protein